MERSEELGRGFSPGAAPIAPARRRRPCEAGAGLPEQAGLVRQAGLAYLLGGAGIIVFTLAAGLVPPARARFLVFPGLAFVLLFGGALVLAPRLWHRPRSVRRALRLVRVLAVANGVRAGLFVLAAAGWNVHLIRDGRPALYVVPSEPHPLFLVNAGAAAAIAALLVRALLAVPVRPAQVGVPARRGRPGEER